MEADKYQDFLNRIGKGRCGGFISVGVYTIPLRLISEQEVDYEHQG